MQQQIPNNGGVVKEVISLKEVILSVRAWWKYMLGKWKVIVLAGIIGGAAGMVYSLVKPVMYRSETSFVLESSKNDGGVMSIAAKFGLGASSNGEGLFGDEDNMVVFLKSRTMGAQTLLTPVVLDGKEELLIDRYLNINNLREKWKSPALKSLTFKAYPQQNSRSADSLVNAIHKTILKKNLSVAKPDKEGNIIAVSTTSPDELFSKAYTETLIANATKFYVDMMTKKSSSNVAILQFQADSIKTLLNRAVSGAAASADAVPNLNPAYQRLKATSQTKVIDIEMNKAILEQLVANLEMAKIELRKETPLIQIVDQSVLPLEKIRTGKLKAIVFGGVIVALICTVYLTVSLFIRNILSGR